MGDTLKVGRGCSLDVVAGPGPASCHSPRAWLGQQPPFPLVWQCRVAPGLPALPGNPVQEGVGEGRCSVQPGLWVFAIGLGSPVLPSGLSLQSSCSLHR